jgi:hypothetical protein
MVTPQANTGILKISKKTVTIIHQPKRPIRDQSIPPFRLSMPVVIKFKLLEIELTPEKWRLNKIISVANVICPSHLKGG